MNWKELLVKAGYAAADADKIVSELGKLNVATVNGLEKVPLAVGLRLAGFPTYKVVSDLAREATYVERGVVETAKPKVEKPKKEAKTPIEQFHARLAAAKIPANFVTKLQELGVVPQTIADIPDEVLAKAEIPTAEIAKIREIASGFTG